MFFKSRGIWFLTQGKSLKKDVGTLKKSLLLVEWRYAVKAAVQDKRRMRTKPFYLQPIFLYFDEAINRKFRSNKLWDLSHWFTMAKLIAFNMNRRKIQYDTSGNV